MDFFAAIQKRLTLSDEVIEQKYNEVRQLYHGPVTPATPVGVTQIRSYICKGMRFSGASLVPKFASHWAIVVHDLMVHLRVEGKCDTVKLYIHGFEQSAVRPGDKIETVGTTRLHLEHVLQIGICLYIRVHV